MEFETQKSKVYIKVDAKGRILRCEGGYTTPADLTGWTYIDEGTGDRFNLCQSHYFAGGLYTMDGVPRYKLEDGKPLLRSENEVAADRQPIIAAHARALRDKLLLETDWTQVLDAPVDTDTREVYRVYRQSLRDIPEQEGFPLTIVWPERPAFLPGKAAVEG